MFFFSWYFILFENVFKGYNLLKIPQTAHWPKLSFIGVSKTVFAFIGNSLYEAWPCEMPQVAKETEKQTWNQSQGGEENEKGRETGGWESLNF